MKIYNVNKIRMLYESVRENLTAEQRLVIKEILESYNTLYIYARDKKQYLERKENQYVKESNENDSFREKIKNLEERLKTKEIIISSLKKENKTLKKLVEDK